MIHNTKSNWNHKDTGSKNWMIEFYVYDKIKLDP